MSANVFAAPVSLQTARLLLRRNTPDDAKPMFETWAQDPEVTRFMTWAPHRSVEETHGYLEYCTTVWRARTAFPWGIVERETGALVGGIEARVDGHRVEFGYVLARRVWGRGYATEASRAVVALALSAPAIQRVWAYVDCEHTASVRVLEKAGLVREGCLRKWYVPSGFGVPRDIWSYAIVKEPS
ncbi:MAG: GNAT family N-acetyltransferase [Candidatus Rokubacteria bacterium]|nr:GNAT family N-acetyltransferase [Candidatus Rokubacteria bacterium]